MPDDARVTSQPDDLLAAILRGDDVALSAADEPLLLDAAARHDIVPLLSFVLRGDGVEPGEQVQRRLSRVFEDRLLAIGQQTVATDLAAEAELRRALEAFDRAAIPVLVVKGSHLAYSHYPRPDLRARTDVDLLITRDQRERADYVLRTELGYLANVKLSGNFTATQALYTRTAANGFCQMIDLHWRLASPQLFANVLSFEEIYASSQGLPALSQVARAPSNVHALVIACTHQMAHHHDEGEQFKWLYDIHLLASRLTPAEWNAFVALIVDRRVSAVCRYCLGRSAHWFHTELPEQLRDSQQLGDAADHEQTASYLARPSQASAVLGDLRALPAWRDRFSLMREHLFPPPDYMRRMYAPSSTLPLPALYMVRAARGAWRWLGFSR